MAEITDEELNWWTNDLRFVARDWWNIPGWKELNLKDRLDYKNEYLVAGKRSNGSNVYRPGPIFWELLRRHPDLPGLRRAASGESDANQLTSDENC